MQSCYIECIIHLPNCSLLFVTIYHLKINANDEIEKAETQIESKAQSFVQSLKTENQSQIDDAMKVGRLSATKELRKVRLTGLNVEQILKEDLEFVQEFLVEVDYVLSESNATTLIEI